MSFISESSFTSFLASLVWTIHWSGRTGILTEREQFVPKPNDDYGGHGVFLGWGTNKHDWQGAVKVAFQVIPIEFISMSCSLTSIRFCSKQGQRSVDSFVIIFTVECNFRWRTNCVAGIGRMTHGCFARIIAFEQSKGLARKVGGWKPEGVASKVRS
jgi:hypothetical protein